MIETMNQLKHLIMDTVIHDRNYEPVKIFDSG